MWYDLNMKYSFGKFTIIAIALFALSGTTYIAEAAECVMRNGVTTQACANGNRCSIAGPIHYDGRDQFGVCDGVSRRGFARFVSNLISDGIQLAMNIITPSAVTLDIHQATNPTPVNTNPSHQNQEITLAEIMAWGQKMRDAAQTAAPTLPPGAVWANDRSGFYSCDTSGTTGGGNNGNTGGENGLCYMSDDEATNEDCLRRLGPN
jgi:hypothetical protein